MKYFQSSEPQTCIQTDKSGREIAHHGSDMLPVAVYHSDLSSEVIPWHWHDEFEFAVVDKGCACLAVNSEKHIVKEGEAFLINSGILHSITPVPNVPCCFRSVVFHPRFIGSIDSLFWHKYLQPIIENKNFSSLVLTPHNFAAADTIGSISNAFDSLEAACECYEFETRRLLSDAVLYLWRQLPAIQTAESSANIRNALRIKAMLGFIHANFAYDISTKDIAASANISESECLRCFHRTINTTPVQYLKEYRIQQAAEMLHGSKRKISDIALCCGFTDMSYFSRSFKAVKGCTPKAYRQDYDK